ncbi:MAG: site-specific integrase [Bacteroidales bacterium]|nr:site-specific integrase [Bacteroidales bacterium]
MTVTDSQLSSDRKKVKDIRMAQRIEKLRRKFQDRLFDLAIELTGEEVDAAYIAERLTATGGDVDFFEFAEEWMKHTSTKSLENYRSMLHALETFQQKRTLPFSRINYALLEGFQEFLKDKPRAKSMYLGLMRHLYREAMRKYNTDCEQVINNDPFVRFKVPRQIMKKGVRSLSLEELMKVYQYKGKEGSRSQLARDCFILSFCLMGMNSVDLFGVSNMKGGIIRYNRTKTKDRRNDEAYIEVKVHPFIMPLMKKYKGISRVFNFYKRYSTYRTFNSNINKGLKIVGQSAGIDNLQFYQARHTFATLTRNLLKVSKSDVDEALNHVGTMDIADVYIAKDFSIINDNNFRLIDTIFNSSSI